MIARKNNWEKKELPIKSLLLWDENSRLPDYLFNADQNKLIQTILADEKFKIKEFISEVVKDFDLPQLEKMVVLEKDKKYIVLEGNRRLLSYKCLANPELAGNYKSFFDAKKQQIKIEDNFKVEVVLTKKIEEAERFVDRKHNKGNNEVGWGEFERHNHVVRRKMLLGGKKSDSDSVFRVNLGNKVKEVDLPEEMKNEILSKGYVTNFYRLLSSLPARERLGYERSDDGELKIKDEKIFLALLKIVIFDLLTEREFKGKKINSRSLNTNEEKGEYFKTISEKDIKRVDEGIKNNTSENLFGEQKIDLSLGQGGKKSNPTSFSRCSLIPSSTVLKINETRLNNIYRELKSIKISEFSNAVAVLFRVFLECSIDQYVEDKKIQVKKNKDHDPSLCEKLKAIKDSLGLSDDGKKVVNKAIASKDNICSIDTFHSYVHNKKINPSPDELKISWDNFQEFFEKLWGSLE